MGLLLSIVFGLCLWVLLWGLGVKSLDAFLLTGAIVLVAAAMRMVSQHLPGNRDPDEADRGGSWLPR